MDDADAPPTPGRLAVLGVTLALLAVLGAVRLGWPAGLAGGAVCAVYAASGAARLRIHDAWRRVTRPIGWIVGHALLAVIFFGVVTPIAIVLRATGHDPLALRAGRPAWSVRTDRTDPFRRF